jgi:hypothetical protein
VRVSDVLKETGSLTQLPRRAIGKHATRQGVTSVAGYNGNFVLSECVAEFDPRRAPKWNTLLQGFAVISGSSLSSRPSAEGETRHG